MSADNPEDEAGETAKERLEEALTKSEQKDAALVEAELDQVLEGTVEDPKQRQALKRIFTLARQHQQYTGPVPSPELLEGFGRVMPGLPERLISAWEKETDFRHEMEREDRGLRKAALDCDIAARSDESSLRRNAQLHAFIIVSALLVIGAFLGYKGHDYLAGLIFGTTIISVLVIYILGKRPSRAHEKDGDED